MADYSWTYKTWCNNSTALKHSQFMPKIFRWKEGIVSEYKHVLSRLKWLNIAANSEIEQTGSFFKKKKKQEEV